MAEQSNRDVVDQTLSGGEPSPSDVPASTNDNLSAGGDAGKTEHIAMATATSNNSNLNNPQNDEKTNTLDSRGKEPPVTRTLEDTSKQGAGVIATRVLELNGLASASDGGDDTASQGGSESDASRSDGRNPTHSGSVKKPAGFKPVSFAKFSVNKVPGAPTPPKVPEKAPTSTTPLGTPQSSSRPRLVAKTTLGMRDSFSKTGAGGGKPGGSGPDPNQVWNKNRPVVPAPPKHLTDEELKQQYGIHMTSRIQEDGAVSSEAKWADIDDDEDDWAPETIEWTDGTKVNLTQHHTEPAPAPSHREPKELPPVEPSIVKEPPKIVPKPTVSMGSRAMVLKVGANAERQARTASASSNGTNDKVPSSSTSPAPPSKSPWAPLPPVERVSPVIAPVQPHQQRMSARYPQRDDGHHAPTSMPPKEIAADDFNRAWKDQSDLPQLFNPRSSQYEPVAETRRGSWRHDQHPRAPAVLQRPNDQTSGPAEPSAAFQTHRSSHQDGMGWGGRRRTSSNVSGGSGGFGRRMSVGRFDPPPRYNDARRGSQVNGMGDSAIVGHEQHHGKDEIPLSGPNGTARPAVDVGMSPVETQAVPLVPQEPQEDPVALQERIMKEKRLEARQRRIEQEEKEEAAKKERIRQRLAAMGPAPEKKTPETRNPPLFNLNLILNLNLTLTLFILHKPLPNFPIHPSILFLHPPNLLFQNPIGNRNSMSKASDTKLDEHGTQWQGNLTSTSSWSHPNIAVPSTSAKNLWKPFGSDRTPTLGNGIFDQPLGTFASRENLLGQLGMDSSNMPTPPKFSAPNEPTDSLPSPEARHPSFDPLNPIGRPSPIGPPSNRNRSLNDWNTFHENALEKEAQNNKDFLKRLHDRQKGVPPPPPPPVVFTETWKKTRATEDGRRIVTQVTERVVNNDEDIAKAKAAAANQQSNPLTSLDTPMDGLNVSDIGARPTGNVPTRSSRFFPPASEQSKRQFAEKERSSPSPPPPEEVTSHPVYSGDSTRPHVNLPTPKPPKPVVKLPPKAIGAPAPPPTFASMAAAPPRNAAPPSTALSWQDKINGLFGKTTPTQKKSVLAVTSATKEPLPVHAAPVSVSIPQTKISSQSGDGDIAVRQVNEQDEMFEDREPGSLPAVRVPNMAPQNSWSATRPSERSRGKNFKPVQAQSIQPFLVGHNDRDSHGNTRASVFLPGGSEPKGVLIQRKAGPTRGRNTNNNGSINARPRKGINNKSGDVSGGSKKPTGNTVSRQQPRQRSGWSPEPPTSR
ncbi:ATPase F0 complex subunit F mitochondria [Penicillium cf. griseofulvum]|uniref:ATPase F0 complex subunit F mitochondria n=1 Tax=Penicillium cf. griseofulvum TaxID=2972120 RepID=A0A9W9MQP6_9EURO|nr:ATPase F0 complex subunit F mitochondria [Penicillium cf. griseofulvum]